MNDYEVTLPTTPEEAYLQARTGAELFAAELRAWSPIRVIAANSMGLGWPLSEEAAHQLGATGFYAGALRDTIIVTWLRSIPTAREDAERRRERDAERTERKGEQDRRGEWTVDRASRSPREAFDAAAAWAEKNGMIDLQSQALVKPYQLMLATLTGQAVSAFETLPPPDAEGAAPPETIDPNV